MVLQALLGFQRDQLLPNTSIKNLRFYKASNAPATRRFDFIFTEHLLYDLNHCVSRVRCR